MTEDGKAKTGGVQNAPTAATLTEAEQHIAIVIGTVRKALGELSDGKVTNLEEHGLQQQVDSLCGVYERLAVKDAQVLKPRLASLMSALDDLSARLVKARDEVGAQLNQSAQTQAAHKAYATSQSQTPPATAKKDDGNG